MKGLNCLLLPTLLLAALLNSCRNPSPESGEGASVKAAQYFAGDPVELDDYWYQGKAEISSYRLSQNRYRGVHPGEAVLIFVTEDFLVDEQVKDESGGGPASTTVLKTNSLRRFTTGIYDYSIMTSVFTPVEVQTHPYTLKVSTSSQDWCGQTWMQVNREARHYRTSLYSYFESEGDREERVPLTPLEDELYNRIRINPKRLPTGEFELLPGTAYCRLMHLPFEPAAATATLEPYRGDRFKGANLRAYRLHYPDLQRTLTIVFEAETPHRIAGWVEAYPSLSDGVVRETVATHVETVMNAYWQHNDLEDRSMRQDLQLEGR